MKRHLCDPPGLRKIYPLPDQEPVDTSYLTRTLRASWITDADVRELEEDG